MFEGKFESLGENTERHKTSKTSEKMNLKIYRLDPVEFLSVPGLEWQPALKNNEVKSELLTDVDMLLMVEKGIRGGTCHAIHDKR